MKIYIFETKKIYLKMFFFKMKLQFFKQLLRILQYFKIIHSYLVKVADSVFLYYDESSSIMEL